MDQGKSTSDRTPIETAKPENQGLNTPLTSPCKQDPISELRVFNSGFQNFFSSHIHLYGTKIFNKGYAIMMLASLQLRRHHKGHFRKGYAIMMLASFFFSVEKTIPWYSLNQRNLLHLQSIQKIPQGSAQKK